MVEASVIRLLLALALQAFAAEGPVVGPADVPADLSAPRLELPAALPASAALSPVPQIPAAPGELSESPEIPALPAAAVPQAPEAQAQAHAPVSAAASSVLSDPSAPLTMTLGDHVLCQAGAEKPQSLSAGLARLAESAQAARDATSLPAVSHAFDGTGGPIAVAVAGAGSGDASGAAGVSPRIPPGVVRVEVYEVRSAADVSRLIPDGPNSRGLIEGLKREIGRMAPYRIYRYIDAKGGYFTGIDLSQHPQLVEILPEQHSHEVRLIKKIQLYNQDLQSVVREGGKTPDLVMGGVVTELKSLIGNKVDLTFLVNKANTQVYEHGQRHGLGHGAAAIDLTQEDRVPVQAVLDELNAWVAKPVGHVLQDLQAANKYAKSPVVLDRVYVFAGLDLKIFRRQPDGRYALQDPSATPKSRAAAPSVDPKDIHTVQLLLKSGRVSAARRQLRALQRRAPVRVPQSPLEQARERLDAHRFVETVGKLFRRRRYSAALALWDNFKQTHSAAAAHEIEAKVAELLPGVKAPEAVSAASAAGDEGERVKQEINGPRAALAAAGIKAVVTVYGSARILPRVVAERRYEELLARVGPAPAAENDRHELEAARQAVENSKYYEEARRFGELVARLGGGQLAVTTGGGPGIMEAANRGAFEAGGPSIGQNIALPKEQKPNPFQTPGLSFRYESFSARKSNLRYGAAALVYFPGGFGTMDELFEVLTLMQTGKMPRVPIILVGQRDYWNQVLDFPAFSRMGLISEGDLGLFQFADTADEAWFHVSEALRKEPALR